MTVGTKQAGCSDMEGMLPLEPGRIASDIMTTATGSLIHARPIWCVGAVAATEITVTIRSFAGAIGAIPCRPATVSKAVPRNLCNRIQRLTGLSTLVEMS
jgi:hypothetical protein